jgi:hypothetical protein
MILFTCVQNDDTASLKKALALQPHSVNIQDQNGFTPLFYAIMKNQCEMISLLIDFGGDIYIKNKYGLDCLYYAINPNRALEIKIEWESKTPEARAAQAGATVLIRDFFPLKTTSLQLNRTK